MSHPSDRRCGALTARGLATRFRQPGGFGCLTATFFPQPVQPGSVMKVRNSLKSLRSRHRDNRLVRRKGRLYVINKTNRRFKARQG